MMACMRSEHYFTYTLHLYTEEMENMGPCHVPSALTVQRQNKGLQKNAETLYITWKIYSTLEHETDFDKEDLKVLSSLIPHVQ